MTPELERTRTMERVLFVTGASGAGKTSVVSALEARALPGVGCFYFDSIGVPPNADASWQRQATRQWLERLRGEACKLAVLDGQVRPSEALAAARQAGISATALLMDCPGELRDERLKTTRGQPELATVQMTTWAAYLRGQADALQLPVIDTGALDLTHATDALERLARALSG
jgi:hypothetical protein